MDVPVASRPAWKYYLNIEEVGSIETCVEDQSRTWRAQPDKKENPEGFFPLAALFLHAAAAQFNCRRQSWVNTMAKRRHYHTVRLRSSCHNRLSICDSAHPLPAGKKFHFFLGAPFIFLIRHHFDGRFVFWPVPGPWFF